tara:strand:+ start:399 stop:578 length:180 start_codon:yes stop_codon:yes gene_type:complete
LLLLRQGDGLLLLLQSAWGGIILKVSKTADVGHLAVPKPNLGYFIETYGREINEPQGIP